MLNFRKIVSLTMLLSFIVVVYSGVFLFIVPEGKVAYWVNWHLLGLSKTQYADVHDVGVLLFLVSSVLHIYLNWSAILNYLKNKSKKIVLFTPNFIAALLITLIFTAGSLYKFPPFESFLNIATSMDKYWAQEYGTPPFGHAELSGLKSLCNKMNLDFKEAKKLLEENGITVKSENETLLKISERAGMTPAEVYKIIKPAKIEGSEEIPSGLGKMSLKEVCKKYDIDIEKALEVLKNQGFNVTSESQMKELSEQRGMLPMDIYELIKNQ